MRKKRFDAVVLISIIFFLYGLFKTLTTNSDDKYIVVFAWLLFAVVWAAIAIMRYYNLCGKC